MAEVDNRRLQRGNSNSRLDYNAGRYSADVQKEQRQRQLLQAVSYTSSPSDAAAATTNAAEDTNVNNRKNNEIKRAPTITDAITVESIDLSITILSGEGLVAKDRNWKGEKTTSDSYIVATLITGTPASYNGSKSDSPGNKKQIRLGKTKVMPGTLNPSWNETFDISLGADDLVSAKGKQQPPPRLQLMIKDHDLMGSNDCMGVVTIPLDTITASINNTPLSSSKWYPVPESSAANASGKLQIALQTTICYSDGSVETPEKPSPATPQVKITNCSSSSKNQQQQQQQQSGQDVEVLDIDLTVVKGDGLAAKDRNIVGMRTTSDPYVDIVLLPTGPGGKELSLGLTETIQKTLSPEWNDEFTTSVPLSILSNDGNAQLRLTIMDHDVNTADDCMGVVHIHLPMRDQERNGGHKIANHDSYKKWYGIPATSASNASGRIQCILKTEQRVVRPMTAQLSAVEEPSNTEDEKLITIHTGNSIGDPNGAGDFMTIAVTVLAGKGLPAKDRNAVGQKTTSDPYVVASLLTTAPGGNSIDVIKLGETKAISKSLEPMWNERFETTFYGKELVRVNEAQLQLRVYDKDEMTQDDLMGIVTLPIQLETKGGTTRWFGIPANSARNASGRLRVKIETSMTCNAANLRRKRSKSSDNGDDPVAKTKKDRARRNLLSRSTSVRDPDKMDPKFSRSGSTRRINSGEKSANPKARSKDMSAFCTPRRTVPKSLKLAGKVPKLADVGISMDDDANADVSWKKAIKPFRRKVEKTNSASNTKPSRFENTRKVVSSNETTGDTPLSVANPSIQSSSDKDVVKAPAATPAAKTHSTVPIKENSANATPAPAPSPPPATTEASLPPGDGMTLRPPSPVWTCKCGYDSDKNRCFCGMCGMKQHWSCTQCDFDKNICLYNFCCMCGVPNSNSNSNNEEEDAKA